MSLKELFEELRYFGITIIIFIGIMLIAFHKDNHLAIGTFSLTLGLIYLLPGWIITSGWKQDYPFIERIIIGTLGVILISGIFSYFFGIIGLNVKYSAVIIPIIIGIIGIIRGEINSKNNRRDTEQ